MWLRLLAHPECGVHVCSFEPSQCIGAFRCRGSGVEGWGGNWLEVILASQLQTCIYSATPSSRRIFYSIIQERYTQSLQFLPCVTRARRGNCQWVLMLWVVEINQNTSRGSHYIWHHQSHVKMAFHITRPAKWQMPLVATICSHVSKWHATYSIYLSKFCVAVHKRTYTPLMGPVVATLRRTHDKRLFFDIYSWIFPPQACRNGYSNSKLQSTSTHICHALTPCVAFVTWLLRP